MGGVARTGEPGARARTGEPGARARTGGACRRLAGHPAVQGDGRAVARDAGHDHDAGRPDRPRPGRLDRQRQNPDGQWPTSSADAVDFATANSESAIRRSPRAERRTTVVGRTAVLSGRCWTRRAPGGSFPRAPGQRTRPSGAGGGIPTNSGTRRQRRWWRSRGEPGRRTPPATVRPWLMHQTRARWPRSVPTCGGGGRRPDAICRAWRATYGSAGRSSTRSSTARSSARRTSPRWCAR
jgi:hypothetical protein